MKKKVLTLVLAGLMTTLLFGCGSNGAGADSANANNEAQSAGDQNNVVTGNPSENGENGENAENKEGAENQGVTDNSNPVAIEAKNKLGIDVIPPVSVTQTVSYEIPNDDTVVMNCVMENKYTTLYATKNASKSGVTMLETGINDWVTSDWRYGLNDESIEINQAVSPSRQLYTYSFEYMNTFYCFCMEDDIPQEQMGTYLDSVLLTIGAL